MFFHLFACDVLLLLFALDILHFVHKKLDELNCQRTFLITIIIVIIVISVISVGSSCFRYDDGGIFMYNDF